MNDIVRIVSGAAWVAVAAYLTPCLWRSLTRRARPLDPIWGTFWFLAVNRVAFTLRGLYAPTLDAALFFCHLFGLIGAGLVIMLARANRGEQ